jgi:hypothetical protein
VRTLVAHEPPVVKLLPGRAQVRAQIQDIYDTYRVGRAEEAMQKFMTHAGLGNPAAQDEGAPRWVPSPEQMAQMHVATGHFLAHLICPTTGYRPDIEALRAAPGVSWSPPGPRRRGSWPTVRPWHCHQHAAEIVTSRSPPSRLVRCQLVHPAVGDHLVAHLGHEHLARLTGDVAGELLAAVSGIHPTDLGDQLDRRADIVYPERLDSHGVAGRLRRTPSRDRIQRPNGCALQPHRDSLGDEIDGHRRATRQEGSIPDGRAAGHRLGRGPVTR